MFQFLFPNSYHNHIAQQLDQIIAKLDTITYDQNQETKPNKNIRNKIAPKTISGLDKQAEQSNSTRDCSATRL